MERARGIYSFSHLTFQEYFTAKYIVQNLAAGTLKRLVDQHLTKDKWEEVILLTANLLDQADDFLLLMKEKVDSLVSEEIAVILKVVFRLEAKENTLLANTIITPVLARIRRLILLFDRTRNIGRPRSGIFNILYALEDLSHNLKDYESEELGGGHNHPFSADRMLVGRLDDITDTLSTLSEPDPDLIFYLARDRDSVYFDQWVNYIKASNRLVKCINTECYVSKQVRHGILTELFSFPNYIRNTPLLGGHPLC